MLCQVRQSLCVDGKLHLSWVSLGDLLWASELHPCTVSLSTNLRLPTPDVMPNHSMKSMPLTGAQQVLHNSASCAATVWFD